jgi:SNF2 family DNA or RNA helicase
MSVRSSGIDWFDLDARLDFDGVPAPLPALLRAARDRDVLVRLADGSTGILPAEWLARWARLLSLGKVEEDVVRYRRSQAMLLDALLAEHRDADVDRTYRNLVERLGRHQTIAAVAQPPGFTGTLRDYQREGLAWLRFLDEIGFGGCLADDMGLGKTVQILAHLQAVRREAGRRREPPALIVVPRSLVFNWIDEARHFTPDLRVLDYTGSGRAALGATLDRHDVVITTYGTLRRDGAALARKTFSYVILDEAQAVKNASSQTAKACRALRAKQRLALTGTPVENHLGEAASIFDFLNPGLLGGVEARGSLAKADEATAELVARAVRPFLLRRTKEQVLAELPPKTEQTIHCELSRPQRILYDELRDHYRAALLPRLERDGLERSTMHVLEALLRLRQAALHPGLIDRSRASEPAAKLETLWESLEEVLASGHKAIIFSQFTSFLAIVRKLLDAKGVQYEYLDGATRQRQEAVARFRDDESCRLFLVSLKAGGHGLNLTAADYVFLLDPWWNPAVEAQAIDRTHRIGQTRPVFAYRIVARDTIEEKILELQERKRNVAKALFADSGGGLRGLTADDVRFLLDL